MKKWIQNYIEEQKKLLEKIPIDICEEIIQKFKIAYQNDKQIFIFGNGGSAANASHFATDLGKGASDVLKKTFHCLSLNENTSWITAIGNDYSYEDVFLNQLKNYAKKGDIVLTMSVSGNSPNLVKAFQWANENGLETIAFVGGKKGKLYEIAKTSIVIDSLHYGRVEDIHSILCHLIAYAFMEIEELKKL